MTTSIPFLNQTVKLIEKSGSDPKVTPGMKRPESSNLQNIHLEYSEFSKNRSNVKSAL